MSPWKVRIFFIIELLVLLNELKFELIVASIVAKLAKIYLVTFFNRV